jgi:lysophospholipid acyltransferase (LPLAT)-like uncharacterized protein
MKSWDRFLFFYPFSRIVALYGKPMTIRADSGDEEFERERRRVEQALNTLDAEADAHFD